MAQRRATESLSHISNVTHRFLEETLHLSSSAINNPSSPDLSRRSSSFSAIGLSKGWHIAAHLLDPTREPALINVHKLTKAKLAIADSYKRLKCSFKDMQDLYTVSKDSINVYQRYADMKHMIKQVLALEMNSWLLIDLPKQDTNESQVDYVNKIVNHIEQEQNKHEQMNNKSPKKRFSTIDSPQHNIAERTSSRHSSISEILKGKPTDELKKDQILLQNEIYTLVTKYLGLRELALKLKTVYENSKSQQSVQRYYLLKHLIKDILRSSAFLSICHEIDDF